VDRKEDRRQKAILGAIRFETDGRAFFLEAARKTKDYFGKAIFTSLAEEERNHIERIKVIGRSLDETGEWPSSEDPTSAPSETVFEEARRQIDNRVLDRTNDIEAVKYAIELEKKGYRLYSGLAAQAPDPEEKAFYQQLAREENRHLQILEETWSALIERGTASLD
jgi:rubrerythrin